MFKRSPSLTEQTRLYIKERILNNAFQDGRIPSETELAQALGVSRTTVRDALSKLENEGVIIRKQGAGTFVHPAGLQVRSRLDEIWSYEEMLRAHGYAPSVQVLGVKTAPLDDHAAQQLGRDAGVEALVMEKLFLEDDTPAIFTRNIVPLSLLHCQPTPDQARLPIYEFLEQCSRHRLAYYLSELIPTVADASLARTLAIAAGAPLLALTEIGYDSDNAPILRATSWFRDDRIRFRLIRRRK